MKINKICFIGYGSHVEKTLIPSLKINKKNIKIISAKFLDNKFETFFSIKSALKNISKDYIIYNATPPNVHYRTSKLTLSLGFNIIVEKPLCLNIYQLKKLKNLADSKNLFFFENMMYFYSKQFSLFKKLIASGKKLKSINLNFSIPNFSKKSFRSNSKIPFLLYDVACYPFSLISYLNFKINKFNLVFKFKNNILSYLNITFHSKNINFNITVGYFLKYKNFVKIEFDDQSLAVFHKFFFGKKILKKNIFIDKNRKKKLIYLNDLNVFKKIFNFEKKIFHKLSNKNFYIVKDYLKTLTRISKFIKR
jgi:predicted dehydrogenase